MKNTTHHRTAQSPLFTSATAPGPRREGSPSGDASGGEPARAASLASDRSRQEAMPPHREEPDDHESGPVTIPQPPITNRGAEITTPLENRTLIDWAAFTLKTTDPQEVISIIGLDEDLFSALPYGFSGYRQSLRFGNICVFHEGRENMGCHVVLSGEGCRQFEGQFPENPWLLLFGRLLEHKATFTRLDIATDNIDGQLSIDRLKQAILSQEIRTRFKKASDTQSFRLTREEGHTDDGHTLYFGNRQSRVYIRFYDKAAQLSLPGHWNRAELELKKERAQKAVEHLVAGLAVGRLFSGIVNQYMAVITVDDANISRCPLQPWWAEWLASTEKISLTTAKAIKYVDEVMEFVKRQYAPTVAMIRKHLGPARFTDYLQELDTDGQKRMTTRHAQILAVSALKEEDDLAEMVEFDERAAIMQHDGGLGKSAAEIEARLRLRPDWEGRQ